MNYCTYFDSGYMAHGMACLASLQRWDTSAHIAVLALDKRAYELIPRGPVVTVELRETQGAENIWKLTPWWMLRALEIHGGGPLAYVDADMYAMGPLRQAWEECWYASMSVVPHRWTAKYRERLEKNGKYNVGWLAIDGCAESEHMLESWEKWCKEWQPTADNPRFMDQLWIDTAERVRPCHSLGVNLAPYNQEQYTYATDGHAITVSDGTRTDRLILYHFHEWRAKRGANGKLDVHRTGYPLHPFVASEIYPRYEQEALQYAL